MKPKRPLVVASGLLFASAIALWIASAFGTGGKSANQLALVPAAPAQHPTSAQRPDKSLLLREQHAIERSRLAARRARQTTATVKSRYRQRTSERSAQIRQQRSARARHRHHRALLLAPSSPVRARHSAAAGGSGTPTLEPNASSDARRIAKNTLKGSRGAGATVAPKGEATLSKDALDQASAQQAPA